MISQQTKERLLADARQIENDLEVLRKTPDYSARREALMLTKIELDRAMADGGKLPWPFNWCGAVDLDGERHLVKDGRMI